MPTPDEYILSGILSKTANLRATAKQLQENIRFLVLHGGADRLQENWPKRLAETAIKYHQQTDGEHLDIDTLTSILQAKGYSRDEVAEALLAFSACADYEVTPAKFRWWVAQTQEQDKGIELADVLDKTNIILESKIKDEDSVTYSGYRDAVAYLQMELGRIATTSTIHVQPSGNIRTELDDVLAEVERAETGEADVGRIKTGLNLIDEPTGGLDLTDFLLIGAYTSEGKSMACANIAHHCCTHGWNVQIVTARA